MDKRQSVIPIAALFLTALTHPMMTHAATIDRIVAVVNGEIITSSELQWAVNQAKLGLLTPIPDPHQDISQEGPSDREALRQLIDKKLQLQWARKRGITVGPEEVERALEDVKQRNGILSDTALQTTLKKEHLNLDQYREELKDQMMILKLVNREVKAGVVLSNEEVRSYYQEQSNRFLSPPEYHLHQIFLPIPKPQVAQTVYQTAKVLVARLKSGADFQAIVQEYSDGPDAKNGGDLGHLRKDQLLPEIQRAIEHLEPGGISEPVRTPAGIHIFRLDELKRAHPRPFEEVKDEIQVLLFQERSVELYEQWLKDLRATAQVEIKF